MLILPPLPILSGSSTLLKTPDGTLTISSSVLKFIVPFKETVSVASMVMLPAFPRPLVLALTLAPLTSDRLVAVMFILPESPFALVLASMFA